jgi:hypothetical protein
VGAEATAYLKYCMDFYESLPEYTIFLHDEEFSWHHQGSIIDRITEATGCGWSGDYRTLNNVHNLPWFYWDDNSNSNVVRFYNDHLLEYMGPIEQFGEFLGPTRIGAAQMIVSRSAILARPFDMYRRIYERLLSMADIPGAPKEAGIMLEYFWCIIFGEVKPIDWNAADKICVYCRQEFPYKSVYSRQAIDFFVGAGATIPEDLSKYTWFIEFKEGRPGFNFDVFYTRLLDLFTDIVPDHSFLFHDDILEKHFNCGDGIPLIRIEKSAATV